MQARELLDQGNLNAAIERLGTELRDHPNDSTQRVFLFELLSFAGEWDRAGRQLDALSAQADGPTLLGIQLSQNLLDAERKRTQLFEQGVRPRFLLDPPEAVRQHLEAIELLRQGRSQEARTALDQAEAARTPLSGRLGDTRFDDFRDADDLLGPILEVFAPTGYFWVPWEQIQYLEVAPPTTLRELCWANAKLATWDGQLGEVHLPVLYPGSSKHPDDAVRLGRKTEWLEHDSGIVRGVGTRLLLVGEDARTLLELNSLRFEPPADLNPSEPAQTSNP